MQECKTLLRKAVWVFGENLTAPLLWGREQALILVKNLCDVQSEISTKVDAPFTIVVGSPDDNLLIRQAFDCKLIDQDTLGLDDYRILSTVEEGRDVLLIAGMHDRAALHGLFAFFETLGCRFLLSGDVLPDLDIDLNIPYLDITGHTKCSWRAIWLQFCMVQNSILSLVDYERLFTQMAKMRMNRVLYYHFENEPFIDYEYCGERKLIGDVTHPESACMSLGRQDAGSYRVEDILVGREKFDRDYVAPMEFQQVRTSAETLDAGRAFMQKLIQMATQRGIGTWISFDSTFVSLNMAKYMRPMPRTLELYSALTSFTDPVVSEINRKRIEFITTAYPDIEGILFQITEGAYEDPHPESQAVIDREWPEYQEAYELMKRHWGKHWVGEEMQRKYMRSDIGFVERMKQTMTAAREIKPELKLGILTVCKAYLLTHLDQVLPKDVSFVDIEAQSLWTVDGAPLHLFKRMKGRECVLVPRAYDDGSCAGLQCNLNLYQRDGFLASRRQNGTSGLAVQLSHITGNDHNVRFLAEGMWNENLTPEAFYNDYTKTLFGVEAAKSICEAFRILEDNEVFLGGRGLKNMPYSVNPTEIYIIKFAKNHSTPFFSSPWSHSLLESAVAARTIKFKQAISNLQSARYAFEKGRKYCRPDAQDYLMNLIGKTEAYGIHLGTLCMIPDVFSMTAQAFEELKADGPVSCRNRLDEACLLATRTEENATKAARYFADCAVHPTDLATLWMMNHILIGTRVLRQYLNNVLAYYKGQEYWNDVDWHLFYDTSPFPTFTKEDGDTMVLY